MSFERILVTGASGFLGRNLVPVLQSKYGKEKVIAVSSKDADFLDSGAVKKLFDDVKPDGFVHLAAYSGGIGANRKFPADFYYINTLITANGFEYAARSKVRKMIYTMGGCAYPAKAKSPISEDQMWDGYPQEESAGYSAAKKQGIVASRSYRTQHGLNSVVLIPGNLYGPFDNYRNDESHVVPAFIRRFYEAKLSGAPFVTQWGSGKPERDFCYAGDVASVIPFFLENYDSSEPVNISSGTTTSIRHLSETIAKLSGYKGEIRWDDSKPDGQMVKIFAVDRMKELSLSCPTPLEEGLKKTIDWFISHYESRTDGLRL
jgi:GDP-L-fucose synthase